MALQTHWMKVMTVASAGMLMLMGVGAAPAPAPRKQAPRPATEPKAWIDAKTFSVFPLGEGAMPDDAQSLRAALYEGWKQAIVVPDPDKAVTIAGGVYPSVATMLIDFSDGRVRPFDKNNKGGKIEINNKVEKNLHVEHLVVRGEPVLVRTSRMNMRLTADTAKIDFERDRHGKPVMMLEEAKSGTLSFDVSRADAESLVLHDAREMASHYGISIESIHINIFPETPRSIQASVYFETKVAFIPAGILFQAHIAIDDSMNARISGLDCQGDEVLGPLIVHFLRPSMARYNGKTHPLMSFPAANMKLRDVAVRVDDSLHLTAAFGS